MRSEAPALLPIFRSQSQMRILGRVLLSPDVEYTLTDLASELGIALSTVSDEVRRLAEASLFETRSIGRARVVRANRANPATGHLAKLLEVSVGVPAVITEEFAELRDVDDIILFGSWAARNAGKPGPPPADIDVMVVGPKATRVRAYRCAQRAEERLGIAVNVTVRSPASWHSAAHDSMLSDIRANPYLVIRGSDSVDDTAGH
ncbi:MAG: putative nucleotidyltransferase [Rhodococcus sp. (in: high G+C Gram-positive bacteria)]|jgi:predicted nucleotidyltransferase